MVVPRLPTTLFSNSSSDTDSNATPIEQKQAEKSTGAGKDNWQGFLLACLTNMVYTLIIGIIGGNFLFFMSLNHLQKEAFFPSILQDYFPDSLIGGLTSLLTPSEEKIAKSVREAGSGSSTSGKVLEGIIEAGRAATGTSAIGVAASQLKGGRKKQKGGGWQCKAHKGVSVSMPKGTGSLLTKIGIPPSGGWPYTMRKAGDAGFSFQGVKDWYALSVADTYCSSRWFIQELLSIVEAALGGYDGAVMLVGFAVMLAASVLSIQIPIIPICIFFVAFFNCCIRAGEPADAWYKKLFVVFLGIFPSIFTAGGVAVMQPIQYFLTFLFMPLMAAPHTIREILSCNQETLALIFGGLCVSSAATYLDSSMSVTMMIVYIILLIKSFF